MIETGFGKEFSEPPNVTVSAARTHCEACQEPLDPNVMHKCHGNKHYEPPVVSYTHITEPCPECGGGGMVAKQEMWGLAKTLTSYAIVCEKCRTYLWPLVDNIGDAIASWNAQAMTGKKGCWPKWLADMPGVDEAARATAQAIGIVPGTPDLTNYKGICPNCQGLCAVLTRETNETVPCDLCDGKGVIG